MYCNGKSEHHVPTHVQPCFKCSWHEFGFLALFVFGATRCLCVASRSFQSSLRFLFLFRQAACAVRVLEDCLQYCQWQFVYVGQDELSKQETVKHLNALTILWILVSPDWGATHACLLLPDHLDSIFNGRHGMRCCLWMACKILNITLL